MCLSPSGHTHVQVKIIGREASTLMQKSILNKENPILKVSYLSLGSFLYDIMQHRVTVTKDDLQGYIIQSQGQSVIKEKKNWLVLLLQ